MPVCLFKSCLKTPFGEYVIVIFINFSLGPIVAVYLVATIIPLWILTLISSFLPTYFNLGYIDAVDFRI